MVRSTTSPREVRRSARYSTSVHPTRRVRSTFPARIRSLFPPVATCCVVKTAADFSFPWGVMSRSLHVDVIQWCPKNNPVRALLGSLKASVDPVPLPVYPVKVEADGTILTTFVK